MEAILGPADDENAPPEALNIRDAASAAVAWADKQQARGAARSTGGATPAGAADLVAELHAAREAQAIAEAHAAQFEAERDSAAAARELLRTLVAHLIGERAYLAGQLTRTYQRPWKPIKPAFNHLLRMLGAASGLISEGMSARLASSAEKRSPKRFDRFLAPPGAPAPKAPAIRTNPRVREQAAAEPCRRRQRAAAHLRSSARFRNHPLFRKAVVDFPMSEIDRRFPPAIPFEVIVDGRRFGRSRG